jgi:hypothetical protein
VHVSVIERVRRTGLTGLVILGAAGGAVLTACGDGEDRPGVEVIGTAGAGSASASGIGPVTGGNEIYAPVSNVEGYNNLSLDLQEIRDIMAPARDGGEVDWNAVAAIYQDGKNSLRGDGTLRTLQSIATDEAVLAVFPDGAAVYGDANFLDARMTDAIEGTGVAAGLSDNSRRQIVEKTMLAIVYAKALQEIDAARVKVEENNLADADGAPHNVDEAWGLYAGAANPDGSRPYSLSATALSREGNFGLEGKLDTPLYEALAATLAAAQAGDLEAFDAAAASVRGYMNSIFYLASLRYVNESVKDTDAAARETHLAEGWSFFQTIRTAVAAGDAGAAEAIEGVYTSDPADALPEEAIDSVYGALNEEAVLEALAIPADLVVTEPPAE